MIKYLCKQKMMDWRNIMLKYPRTMHGGELWAKIEVLENVFTPLFVKRN